MCFNSPKMREKQQMSAGIRPRRKCIRGMSFRVQLIRGNQDALWRKRKRKRTVSNSTAIARATHLPTTIQMMISERKKCSMGQNTADPVVYLLRNQQTSSNKLPHSPFHLLNPIAQLQAILRGCFGQCRTKSDEFFINLSRMFKIKSGERGIKASNAKIGKIRQLLTLAMDEIKGNNRGCNSASSSPTKRRSDESSESESIAEVLRHMRKGFLFLKHSVNTRDPHPKFVYLSIDNKLLCWKSPQKDDEKSIELQSINNVIRTSCEFYMKACRGVRNINACIVVCSPLRNLELEAANEIEAEIFKEELNRVIKYMRGMSHNYNYTK